MRSFIRKSFAAIVCIAAALILVSAAIISKPKRFDISSYGAVADGSTVSIKAM